jgi:hypothetical protein
VEVQREHLMRCHIPIDELGRLQAKAESPDAASVGGVPR